MQVYPLGSGSRLAVAFLPKASLDINEPVENHHVGQSGYSDKAEVGLPGDCSEHYQEKPYIA